MNHLSAHPVGLYSLSALSVLVLSKKEGWLALGSTVLLVISCVVRAMLTQAESSVDEVPLKYHYPKARRSRSRTLRADAQPFVPKAQNIAPQIQSYRQLLTTPVAPEPSFRPPPGLAAPPGLAPPLEEKKLLPVTEWTLSKGTAEAAARHAEARALLATLVELEKDAPISLSHDGRTRKPAGRRIVAGVRETTRAVANGRAAAVMVAEDLSWTDGRLEEPKMQKMVDEASAKGVPVVVGLSRQELGDTISKDVAAAVLAILDVSGAEDAFSSFLQVATSAGHAPAPAA